MLRWILVAIPFALAAVSQPASPGEVGDRSEATGAPALEAPTLPPETAAPAAFPVREPGVYRNGSFSIRVEQCVLSYTRDAVGRVHLTANLTLTYANAGVEPMSVVLVGYDRNMNMLLDNGVRLSAGLSANPGVPNCRRAVESCLLANADDYLQIAPGDSASVNIGLQAMIPGDHPDVGSLPSVESGNLVLHLHLVEGAVGRVLQASLLNTPLRNTIRI